MTALYPEPHAPLPDYAVLLRVPRGIGGRLKSRPFSGPTFLANKLLRTYYRIAVSVLTFMLSSKVDAVGVSYLAYT